MLLHVNKQTEMVLQPTVYADDATANRITKNLSITKRMNE